MAMPLWFFFLLAFLGVLHVTVVSVRFLTYLSLFLRRPIDLRRRYGAWAIVTGPTSGIGRSMALELASRGLNIILVGRDPAKLHDVSRTISTTHSVQTRTLLFDLALVGTTEGEEAMRRLREVVEGLDIGILVNNAGVVKPGAMYFHEARIESLVRIIDVNVLALTQVTSVVVPEMLRRGRGAIVNVGSGSSFGVPSYPLYSVYVATKRYVLEFSRSLSVEYKCRGIDVQCQIPFLVETNMVSNAVKASFFPLFVPTPDAYARAAVRWIGHGVLCVPSLVHRLQWWYLYFLPDFLNDGQILQRHLKQRTIFRRLRSWRKTHDNCVAIENNNGFGDVSVMPNTKVMSTLKDACTRGGYLSPHNCLSGFFMASFTVPFTTPKK